MISTRAGRRKRPRVAELEEQLGRRMDELSRAREQQAATADVLQVISSSPGDLKPVFEAMLAKAMRLCEAQCGFIYQMEKGAMRAMAEIGVPLALAEYRRHHLHTGGAATPVDVMLATKKPAHVHDARDSDAYRKGNPNAVAGVDLGGARTVLYIPMIRNTDIVGVINLYRQEVKPFTDDQIALLENFASQAVVAIENARLFNEVEVKTRDLSEALKYQIGSASILNVIASSPTNVQPVLEAIVESACELCEAYDAVVILKDGEELRLSAHHGPIPMNRQRWANDRTSASGRAIADRAPVHIHDILSDEGLDFAMAQRMSVVDGCRTLLSAPLLREGEAIGAIALRRMEAHPFSEKQVALLQTFADQAVIAIGNVRLFDEVQARTRELSETLQQQTASAEVLKVMSRSPDKLNPVLDVIVETSRELCSALTAVIFLLRDGKFYDVAESSAKPAYIEAIRAKPIALDQKGSIMARAAREGRTVHIPNSAEDPEAGLGGPLDSGGPRSLLSVPLLLDGHVIGGITLQQSRLAPFTARQIEAVETFADQAVIAISNVNLFEQVQQRTFDLTKSLEELRTAQDRLVQTEKLASLGQLTAGIAHEIKNPLNFVNNFSTLSSELIEELNELLKSAPFSDKLRQNVDELTGLLKDNLGKVVQHGKRADSIVKNMLLHSREHSGERRSAEINALVGESLNLAYHGARAEKAGFSITLKHDFDPEVGAVDLYPQEFTRALLNVISNGFYAATRRKAELGDETFEPVLSAMTRNLGKTVEIRIRDNGTGIPPEVREKMFNPFFTTKPTGEGTGLGLSMTHDIIVKQHGGSIDVQTEPGAFTEFIITLPAQH